MRYDQTPDDPRIARMGDDPERIECPDCEGDGMWSMETETSYNGVRQLLTFDGPCKRCSGKGWIRNPDL